MSQQYTPVVWEDETPTQPGTLINKARLDQMQGAHHFADGFEEVDVVPTADPQVDYHKVVFCTADTTFYRWDGNQWTKDIDDETKALLLAHEADHSNPHVVTKAQVGLGNADNTSDLNKPISTATQTALDAKLDDSQLVTSWGGTPSDGKIPSEKLVKDSLDTKAPTTALTDGSVTKIGTATVGGDLKPVYLNAGVPTAVTNDLVDTATAQTIGGAKTFTSAPVITANSIIINNSNHKYLTAQDGLGNVISTIQFTSVGAINIIPGVTAGGIKAVTIQDQRAYNPANTSDVATIGTLDGYTPMVRTTGNQSIDGLKSFGYTPRGVRFISTTTGQKEALKIPAATVLETVTCYLVGRIIDRTNAREADFLLSFRTADFTPVLKTSAPMIGVYCTLNADYSVSIWCGTQRVLVFADVLTRANYTSEFSVTDYVQEGTTILPNKPTVGDDYLKVVDSTIMDDLIDTAALAASSAVVHTTGAETVAGIKTWISKQIINYTTLELYNSAMAIQSNGYDLSNPPTYATRTLMQLYTGTNLDQVASRDEFTIATGGNSRNMIVHSYDSDDQDQTAILSLVSYRNGTSCVKGPSRAYVASNTTDMVNIALLDAYTPMVRTTGNQSIGGNKTLTGLTDLSQTRLVTTGGSGYKILYRFKNDHAQTLFMTGGRTIVVAQVHRGGGYKKTLATSGRDYTTPSWLWAVKDAMTGEYYLVCHGLYSATMNVHFINSFLYGTVYPHQDDIEIIDQSTSDPTTDTRWDTVTEVGNYD